MALRQRALRGWGTRGARQFSTFALSNSQLQEVEVEVVHARDKYSVTVTVPSTATIEQVKQILVSDMGEGEVEDVRFFLYDGTTAELMDSEKIGTRRRLHGDGFGAEDSEVQSSGAEEEEQELGPPDDVKEQTEVVLLSAGAGLGAVREASELLEASPMEQAIKLLDAIVQVVADKAFVNKIDALYQRGGITLKLGLTQLMAQAIEQASAHCGVKADFQKLKVMVWSHRDSALIVEKASEIELMLRCNSGSLFGVFPEKRDTSPPTTKSPPMQKRSTLTPRHAPYEESTNTTNGAHSAIKEVSREISLVDVGKTDKDYDSMMDHLQRREGPTHFRLEPVKIH